MVLTLQMILTSPLGEIQQAGAPEQLWKTYAPCFYIRLVITRVRYDRYTELKPQVKVSHEFTNIYNTHNVLLNGQLVNPSVLIRFDYH